jgi:hypothetical protein
VRVLGTPAASSAGPVEQPGAVHPAECDVALNVLRRVGTASTQ